MPPQHRVVVVFVHNFRDIQADDFIPPRYFCGYDAEYALACTYRVSRKKIGNFSFIRHINKWKFKSYFVRELCRNFQYFSFKYLGSQWSNNFYEVIRFILDWCTREALTLSDCNMNNFTNLKENLSSDYSVSVSHFWDARCVRSPEGNPLVSKTCISAQTVLQGALVKGARKMERD